MSDWYTGGLGADPGRVHSEGRVARAELEEARAAVAEFLGTRPRQVIFTSGGTESVNAAAWGAYRACPQGDIVFADVEHSSVREASARLAPTRMLAVDRLGRIETEALAELIGQHGQGAHQISLVHCQLANHEVGTLQPVTTVIEMCRAAEVPVHVDACAAVGHIGVDLEELGADVVSVSAHKFGGPPGAGVMAVRRGTRLEPFIVGGEQERARRAGFESVPSAVGMAAAAQSLLGPKLAQEASLARAQIERIVTAACAVPDVEMIGDSGNGLPHMATMTVSGVEAEAVLLALDQSGIAVHSGSACSSESLAPSPVLEAMGVDAEHSLRVSVGWSTTDEDVAAFVEAFPRVVSQLRSLRT